MIVSEHPQGSTGWHLDRAGVPSGSEFSRVITTKGEPSKSAKAYMEELAHDAIFGPDENRYCSQDMQNGKDTEPQARILYSMLNNVEVQEVGFCYKDERKDRGCSPDGMQPQKGLEIKCPGWKEFFATVASGIFPMKHFCQVQGSMYIAGFGEWDFFSFYEGVSPFQITVEIDYQWCSKLDRLLNEFNEELATVVQKLKS